MLKPLGEASVSTIGLGGSAMTAPTGHGAVAGSTVQSAGYRSVIPWRGDVNDFQPDVSTARADGDADGDADAEADVDATDGAGEANGGPATPLDGAVSRTTTPATAIRATAAIAASTRT
jgi:hypothetical protein